ncbi:3-hydroxybutyryl-CoA dehydratase [Pseudomonas marincola]|uniref:4-hydroxybenzoyl-CoA thioesterase n=1 Tax=Pseudomonas marincola TaxID=437900 RepID=A0A653E059_9PSED|nr:thioesterase family protein [Pseudomonas marincola]CAE6945526.1 3-hydroxybutyryl-CoA dehydratase [Pseudomonas marincola]
MTRLTTYQTAVLPEWVDYNQHLRDAFYLLVFSYATDSLMDHLGLDEAGRTRTGHTLYTLECHLNYLNEVRLGAEVEVHTQLLAHDKKRLHVHHSLHLVGVEAALAESEQMLMNIDVESGRSAILDAQVNARVEVLSAAHAGLSMPVYVGRVIGLPKR